MSTTATIETNAQLRDAVLAAVQENHIWLNAFAIVKPTDEMLIRIGREIVQRLRDRASLLPAWHGEDGEEPISELQRLTPVLFISINTS